MIANIHDKREEMTAFFLRAAKNWQNYFDAEGLLPGIEPSDEQKAIIQQEEDQLLINGSAGSGKSITLMYKLLKVMTQEKEPKRILYVTFGQTLVQDTYKRLETSEEFQTLRKKHTVYLWTFHKMANELLKKMGAPHSKSLSTSLSSITQDRDTMYARIHSIRDDWMSSKEYELLPIEQKLTQRHTAQFLGDEIQWIKANGLITEDQYIKVERTGRSQNPRLTREQRKSVFHIFQIYQQHLKDKYHDYMDLEDYALQLLKIIDRIPESLKFDYIFVDEVQDLQPMQIVTLVKLTKQQIVLTGDPKQRIYKSSPHSYSNLGLHILGRKNRHLKVNFRSTKQIMQLAAKLKFVDVENDRQDDLDFVKEGQLPVISYHPTKRKMADTLVKEINRIYKKEPSATVAVIHREDEKINNGLKNEFESFLIHHFNLVNTDNYWKKYDYLSEKKPLFFSDAFSIKGLEFDHVFIIQFDREHYPLQKRLNEQRKCADKESEQLERDLDQIRSDEKKLLYVAMTRAKKTLHLLYHGKNELRISPFVRDFRGEGYKAIGFNPSRYRS